MEREISFMRQKGTRLPPFFTRPLYYIVCSLLVVLFLFPLVWSVVTSFKPTAEAAASPPTFLPSHLSFDNYQTLISFGSGLVQYVGNSLLVALITVVGTCVLSTLAGYGFAHFSFPGKNVLFIVILSTLMIPFQTILTPLFYLMHLVHLQNTLVGLALVYITFQLPFGIFVMRNAFSVIPRELDEVARIDGCTPLGVLCRVMLVLALPGIVTVGLFAFFASWNELIAALIFINDEQKYTLPVLLVNAQTGLFGTINWGALQAGVTLTMLPCIVLFLLLQRYYINGLFAGAVKG